MKITLKFFFNIVCLYYFMSLSAVAMTDEDTSLVSTHSARAPLVPNTNEDPLQQDLETALLEAGNSRNFLNPDLLRIVVRYAMKAYFCPSEEFMTFLVARHGDYQISWSHSSSRFLSIPYPTYYKIDELDWNLNTDKLHLAMATVARESCPEVPRALAISSAPPFGGQSPSKVTSVSGFRVKATKTLVEGTPPRYQQYYEGGNDQIGWTEFSCTLLKVNGGGCKPDSVKKAFIPKIYEDTVN